MENKSSHTKKHKSKYRCYSPMIAVDKNGFQLSDIVRPFLIEKRIARQQGFQMFEDLEMCKKECDRINKLRKEILL